MRFFALAKSLKSFLLRLLIIMGSLLCIQTTVFSQQKYPFDHFNSKIGLSQNTVYSIVQDDLGFMWFGTQNGLNRFDGYSYESIKKDSLGNSHIRVLESENVPNGFLIGTDKKVFRYNIQLEQITPISIPNSQSTYVNDIVVDKNQNVWLATEKGLLSFPLNPDSTLNKNEHFIIRDEVLSLTLENGLLAWAGTKKGLYRYDLETKTFSFFSLPAKEEADTFSIQFLCMASDTLWVGANNEKGNLFSISESSSGKFVITSFKVFEDNISVIFMEDAHRLWVGVQNEGIHIFDPIKKETIEEFHSNSSHPRVLSHDHILSIYEDHNDGIWIGTFAGGVNRYDERKDIFSYHAYEKKKGEKDPNNFFWSIWEDKNGIFWLGRKDGGVLRFYPEQNIFDSYPIPFFYSRKPPNSPIYKFDTKVTVRSIFQDSKKTFWIGSPSGGLMRYINLPKDTLNYQKAIQPFLNYIGKEEVEIRTISNIPETDTLLLGTTNDGVYIYNTLGLEEPLRDDKIFKKLGNDEIRVFTIQPDIHKRGTVWIGTRRHGLVRRNYIKNSARVWDDFQIYSIKQNSQDEDLLWIGTQENGLRVFNKQEEKYCDSCALSFEGAVLSIIEDTIENCLWLTGMNGITRYDIRSRSLNVFDEQHGLLESEFNLGAGIISQTGKIYFAQGNNGLVTFNPSNYKAIQEYSSPIRFTNIFLGNKKISVGDTTVGDKILATSYNIDSVIYADYHDGAATISFFELGYRDPSSVSYEILLYTSSKPLPDTIKNTISNNKISVPFKVRDVFFKNKAVYQLQISSSLYNGTVKNTHPPARIKIIVPTPFWLSWWFIITLIVIVILGFQALFVSRSARGKTHTLIKELTRRNEHLAELHTKINDISRQETVEEVCRLAMHDLIYFFGYDYASLSIVNHLSREIEVIYNTCKPGSKVNPEDWQAKDRRFPLTEKDILPRVVEGGKEIIVIGDIIDGVKTTIDKDSLLDHIVFYKYRHADLVRAFLPMKRRAKEKGAQADYPIGVFEVGYHKSTKKEIAPQEIIDLKLYIDNCAQLYFKNQLVNEDAEIAEDLASFQEEENPNHYLEKITEFLSRKVHASKGYFSLISYDKNEEYVSPPVRGYGISQEELKGVRESNYNSDERKIGIYMHVSETKMPYWADNVKDDPYYMPGLKEVKSQISIPLIYKEKPLGALNLYSPYVAHFDEKKASLLKKYMDQIAGPYVKKKADEATKKLVKPLNIFSDKEVYGPLVDAICDYFQASFVGIFEPNNDEENGEYEKFCFKFINRDTYLDSGTIELERKMKKGEMIQEIKTFPWHNNNPFYNLIKEFQYSLPSAIQAPILVGSNVIANFVIFLNSKEETLLPEDLIFLNLIGQKAGMAIGMAQIVRSLESLSKLAITTINLKGFLRELTRKALLLNLGNPIILFPYKQDTEIKFRDGVYAGDFYENKIKQMYRGKAQGGETRVDLANIIVKEGTKWFRNETEFNEYLKSIKNIRKWEGKKFKNDFWTREKIKSLAVIRLEFDGNPVGVMFFNYRTQRDFTDENRRFIEAFSFMATNALVNANRADFFREMKIQAEMGEKQQTIRADEFQTAYTVLARGINHDIRNNLMQLELLEDEIQTDIYPSLTKRQRVSFERHFRNINFNSKRIDELLKTFNFEKRKHEWINVDYIIDNVIGSFQNKEEKRVKKERGDSQILIQKLGNKNFPGITGNPTLLNMIVYNLVSNSFKAVSEKLAISSGKTGIIDIENQSTETQLIIRITDNGVGIDNSIKKLIFEPYFSDHPTGIGFGLYFSKEIVEKNFNGRIHFESSHNQETKFFIEIPLKP